MLTADKNSYKLPLPLNWVMAYPKSHNFPLSLLFNSLCNNVLLQEAVLFGQLLLFLTVIELSHLLQLFVKTRCFGLYNGQLIVLAINNNDHKMARILTMSSLFIF